MVATYAESWQSQVHRVVRIASLSALVCLGGCATTSPVSESAVDLVSQPKFLSAVEMSDVDAIEIDELALSKPKQVKRFLAVCRNAKWGPFPATMPDTKSHLIRFMSNGEEIHRLSYVGGWLLHRTPDGSTTFGTIHIDDGEWVNKTIDKPLM